MTTQNLVNLTLLQNQHVQQLLGSVPFLSITDVQYLLQTIRFSAFTTTVRSVVAVSLIYSIQFKPEIGFFSVNSRRS